MRPRGLPKSGGRVKGSKNKTTRAKEREIAKSGLTPLEYMLKVMRNPKAPDSRRDDMARAAAPYVHPKLAAVQHTGQGGGPIQHVDLSKLTDEQIAALESLYGPLAGAGGDDGGNQSGEGS
jgi:hypothetical protein